MDLNLTPYIRRAWYDTMPAGAQVGPRVIFDYELVLIKEGRADITIENRHYTARPGDMFVFRPRQQHAIYASPNTPLVQPHIHFDLTYYENRSLVPISYVNMDSIPSEQLSFFREDILDRFISPFPSFFHPNNKFIEMPLFNIIHAMKNPRVFNSIYLQHVFLELWEQVLLEALYANKQIGKREDTAALIKQFIDQNDSKSLILDEIVQATHFSKSYIARVFQEYYGISPMRYHATIQIQKAKQMILFTNMSLSEISSSIGFDSLQDFSRVFKKIDNRTPSSYRRKKQPLSLNQYADLNVEGENRKHD